MIRNLILVLCILFVVQSSYLDLKWTNPYNILQVSPWNSWKKIKMQYKKLSLQNHPDKNKNADVEYYAAIQEAFETIKAQRREHQEKVERSRNNRDSSDNKKNNYEDDDLFNENEDVLQSYLYTTCSQIIGLLSVIGIIKFFSVFIFKFIDYIFKFFIVSGVVTLISIRVFSHLYPSYLIEIFVIIVTSIILTYGTKIKGICKKRPNIIVNQKTK